MIARALELLVPYVPLFQTLLWIIFIAVFAIVFHKQCVQILKTILHRIEKGSSFRAGPVELGADLKSLEYASPTDSNNSCVEEQKDWNVERTGIYQNNKGIFLTHVISPSSNPHQKYDIFIYLIRHKTSDFSDIDKAEFFFGHMWGNHVFEEKETNGIIGVSTSAYAPFLCICRVHFKDGTNIKIDRYIDFEMGRIF